MFASKLPHPSGKVKSIFWDRIPTNRVSATFWAAAELVPLDFEEVEDQFKVYVHAKAKAGGRGDKPRVAVLSHMRSMAIGIRTNKLKSLII